MVTDHILMSTTASASTPPPAAPAPAQTPLTTPDGYRLPSNTTLQHASKISIIEDKPVMLDYWTNSLDKKVLIGVKKEMDENGKEVQEKLLVKSEEEYTSPISKIYKVNTEYIIITENSIYIVDVNIPTKLISS